MSEIYIEEQHLGIGNNGINISFNYFDGLPDNSLLANIKDPNLLLNIRQLFKKDDTTKEKALNKILELLNANANLIKDDITVLVWSMIYPKLTISSSKNATITANEITTIILKYIKDNKVKQLLPYFQDLFPILIFGMSDLEKKVNRASRQNLNHLFNNEQNKVDGLYNVFKVNLLKVIYSVLCIETEETLYNFDASSKDSDLINSIKNRHINLKISAMNLLSELIEKNDYTFINDNEYFQEIMTNKEIYEMLTMKFIQKYGINGPKAMLRLISLIVNKKQKTPSNKDIRIEYWAESINKKILKLIAKNIFKLLDEWNESKQQLLSALTVDVIYLLDSFEDIDKFWEVSKNAYGSLFKWLEFGPGVFTPINYYRELEIFTVDMCLKNEESTNFESHWMAVWDSGFEKELKRHDRMGNVFLEQFWEFFIIVNKKFNAADDGDVLDKMMTTILEKNVTDKMMTIFTKAQPSIIELIEEQVEGVFSKDTSIELSQEYSELKTFVKNALKFLISSSSDKSLSILLDTILENEDNENFILFVNSDKFDKSSHMKSFFIPFLHKVDPSKVNNLINKIQNKELIKDAADEDLSLQSVLFNSSQSSELMSLKTVIHFHDTLDHIEFFAKFNKLSENLKTQYLMFNSDYVQEFATTAYDLDNHDWYDLLSGCCKNNKFVTEIVLKYLESEFIENTDEEDEKHFIDIVKDVIKDNEQSVLEYLSKTDSMSLEKVFKQFEFIDDKLISVAGLEASSLLFKDDIIDGYFVSKKSQFERSLKSLKFDAVLMTLLPDLSSLDENVCFVNYNIIKLLTSHYSIIMNDDLVFDFEDEKFNIIKKTPTINVVDKYILSQETTNTYLDLLTFEDSSSPVLKLYKTKLMSMILSNVMDDTPESAYKVNFTANNTENLILKTLRSTVSSFNNSFTYLLCYLTSIHECYNYNDKVTKLTSYLMSEFHQLQPEQFEKVTYKYLIILINLSKNYNGSETPNFNEMRFNGFIKNIINLYEDIDWYEDETTYKKYLRSLFLRLFINLNGYHSLKPQFLEFSQNLIQENLQICELVIANETSCIGLLEQSLKLLKCVEIDEESMDEVCDTVFNIFIQEQNMESDLIERCLLTHANSKFLDSKFDDLIDTLKDSSFGLRKKRVAFLLLDKIMKTERAINCIDFELDRKEIIKSQSEISSKMKDLDINSDSGSADNEANVDNELKEKYKIDEKILQLLDVFENDNIVSYIWTVGLVMTTLEETTLNLFNLFMTQLGTNWFVERWFEKVYLNIIDENSEVSKDNVFSIDGSKDIKNITYRICQLLTSKSSLNGIYTWYNNFEKTEAEHYSEYFSTCISKPLIKEQMDQLQSNSLLKELKSEFSEFLSIEIKPELNLVKVKFDIDDQTLDIFYQYENDFPLKPIKASVKNNKIGINDKTLKTWLLAIKKTPLILPNISTICNNIKLKFANLEECAICYYVINDTNKSLPNKKCPTCTKKFHNVCLYKWFKNSNSNACPLCRSNFTF